MTILPTSKWGGPATWTTIGLALVGGVVAAVVLFASGRASEVNLTTAGLVPADAAAYYALNTDLASDQWIAAFKLIERLGEDDPLGQLQDAAEGAGGVDWEREVVPFLGGNAAVFVSSLDFFTMNISGAVIIRCKDASKAREVVLEFHGGPFDDHRYSGVDYLAAGDETLFLAVIGEHLVLTWDREGMEAVIDVNNGDRPSLAGASGFQALRDELTKNFLMFAYVNGGSVYGELYGDSALREALDEAGLGDLLFEPVAQVVGAKGDGFHYQAASVSGGGVLAEMLRERTSRFVSLVPADTSIYFSTTNLAQVWTAIVEDAGAAIDDAIRDEGTYRNLDEALVAAGQEVGLESLQEMIDLLTGELAVAAWFPGARTTDAEVVVLAEVGDTEAAESVFQRLLDSDDDASDLETVRVNGVTVTAFSSDGDRLAFATTDGYALFGTFGAVETILRGRETPLGQLNTYQNTVDSLPGGLGTFVFLNLRALMRLDEAEVPGGALGRADRVLQGAIFNMVDQRGVVSSSGVVTIVE